MCINDGDAIRAAYFDGGPSATATDSSATPLSATNLLVPFSIQPTGVGMSTIAAAFASQAGNVWAVNDEDEVISPVAKLRVWTVEEPVLTSVTTLQDYVNQGSVSGMPRGPLAGWGCPAR